MAPPDVPTPSARPDGPTSGRGGGGRRPVPAVVLVVVLAVGIGAGLAVAGLLDRGGGGGSAPLRDGDPRAVSSEADPDASAPLPEPGELLDPAEATDPEAAITGFLTAEARGEFAESYAFLAPVEREEAFRTPATWVSAHGQFPPITGFRVDEIVRRGERVEAVTLTGFRSGLDPVLGLVPARARVTWPLVEEDGRWRVRSQEAVTQPLYPDDAPVQQVARAWVDARGACDDTAAFEADQVLGAPALSQGLCDGSGTADLGPVGTLTDNDDTAALLSAWGPAVFAWARTVPVDAAEPFTLVLGPVGTDWKVVAVVRRATG